MCSLLSPPPLLQVWDNMFTVAMELGKYGKAIQALDRVCELSAKDVIDPAGTAVLARAVLQHCAAHPHSQQWRHMHALLERVCNKFTTNAEHWVVLAEFMVAMPHEGGGGSANDAASSSSSPSLSEASPSPSSTADAAAAALARALQAAEHMTRACRCWQAAPDLDRSVPAFDTLVAGLVRACDFYAAHTPADAHRLYFARTECERTLVRAQNADALKGAAAAASVQTLRALLRTVEERHAALQPKTGAASAAPAASVAAAPVAAAPNSLADMMSMWR